MNRKGEPEQEQGLAWVSEGGQGHPIPLLNSGERRVSGAHLLSHSQSELQGADSPFVGG